jgi:hypothetical protein
MTSQRLTWAGIEAGRTEGDMTFFQRAYVQATHPRYAALYGIALAWSAYFLWSQNWIWALAVVVLGKSMALATVWNEDTSRMVRTGYGKLILAHRHPVNYALHVVGLVGVAYGLWTHAGAWILAGLSVTTLGHLWGWGRHKRTPGG